MSGARAQGAVDITRGGLATVTSMTISPLWVKNRHHNEIFDSLARRSSSLLMNILAGRLNRDDQVTQPESVSTTGSLFKNTVDTVKRAA